MDTLLSGCVPGWLARPVLPTCTWTPLAGSNNLRSNRSFTFRYADNPFIECDPLLVQFAHHWCSGLLRRQNFYDNAVIGTTAKGHAGDEMVNSSNLCGSEFS